MISSKETVSQAKAISKSDPKTMWSATYTEYLKWDDDSFSAAITFAVSSSAGFALTKFYRDTSSENGFFSACVDFARCVAEKYGEDNADCAQRLLKAAYWSSEPDGFGKFASTNSAGVTELFEDFEFDFKETWEKHSSSTAISSE